MGRHSAAVDEQDEAPASAPVSPDAAADLVGRHARSPARATPAGTTGMPAEPPSTAPVDPAQVDPAQVESAQVDPAQVDPAPVSDLTMLRSDSSLLARCLAAVLSPFLLYFVAMAVAGSPGRDWLIWIWIPAVIAGVAAGAFLDNAHKRTSGRSPRPPTVNR